VVGRVVGRVVSVLEKVHLGSDKPLYSFREVGQVFVCHSVISGPCRNLLFMARISQAAA